jgi:hypothetical protein
MTPAAAGYREAPHLTDIRQQRCGHDGCIAWRLRRPGSNGRSGGRAGVAGRRTRRPANTTVARSTVSWAERTNAGHHGSSALAVVA